MKKLALLAVAILFVLVAAPVQAQTFVTFEGMQANGEEVIPALYGQLDRPIDKSQGIFVWGLATEGWREALVSYYRNLRPWLQISGGIGIEKDDSPIRFGTSVWMGKGKLFSFLAMEHGGSGFWYSYTGTYRITNRLEAGIFSRRYFGTGPYASVAVVGKTSVWGTFCPKDQKVLLGIHQGF